MKSIALKGFTLIAAILTNFVASKVSAQVTLDQTLGSESSKLDSTIIRGGSRHGSNLFHSFKEFSIDSSQRIDFASPTGVANIITRVTDAPSRIDGTLGVDGKANFFLVNPRGIYFGSGAKLDMAGTFVGSTASELKFADGSIYSATTPNAPILTMSTPVGLQFGRNPGNIDIKDSRDLTSDYAGSSLLLVGGNVDFNNSQIIVPGAKIELAAIGDRGSVAIDPTKLTNPQELSVTIPNGVVRSDITIQNRSRLSTGDILSGSISLQGRDITISGSDQQHRSLILARLTKGENIGTGGSIFLNATNNLMINGDFTGVTTAPLSGSKNQGGNIIANAQNLSILNGAYLDTTPLDGSSGAGGDIEINVVDKVLIGAPGNGQESDILAGTYGIGNGGNIKITANKLIQRDGSQIATDNLGTSNISVTGKLGNIDIVARESVEVSGVSSVVKDFGFYKATGIVSFTDGAQVSGNIDIQTPRFVLQNGAVISAGTDQSGTGGKVSITGLGGSNAQSVELTGNSGISQALGIENLPGFNNIGNGSRIRSITSRGGTAGDVTIKADRVTLRAGTRIDVGTLTGKGNGGSIDIQAKTLELLEGGQLISTTSGEGLAGNINVAADRVTLAGTDTSFNNRRAFFGFINAANSLSNIRTALDEYLSNPGNETKQNLLSLLNPSNADRSIIADYITILGRNEVAKQSLQSFLLPKNKPELSPVAVNLLLNSSENSGIVTRSLLGATGAGGNIDINATQLLLLRNQGLISANAATNSRGGNVNIQAPAGAVIAVPTENSDISASAINGQGGMVNINALNVIGFSTQVNDKFSNITATSNTGPQGVVTINNLGVDPSQGLQPSPIEPGAPSIAQDCRAVTNTQISKLANSGKGGVTLNPGDLLPSHSIWTDPGGTSVASKPTPTITEAKGWVAGQGRTVVLTNQPNNISTKQADSDARNCYAK
jgi:filamentous hemagglutinin family protein